MKNIYILIFIFTLLSLLQNCPPKKANLDAIAEKYVKLVLETGQYDPLYVDAYYGPVTWKPVIKDSTITDSMAIEGLRIKGEKILKELSIAGLSEPVEKKRYQFLYQQIASLIHRLEQLNGKVRSFDEESLALYDAVALPHPNEYYQNIIQQLDSLLPGQGDINGRLEKLRSQFVIPQDKIEKVFQAAIQECRKRTLEFITLPDSENFKVEYITGQPWAAYNWYKGNCYSVIQVNMDSPFQIERVLHLASHEGYPGHHVYNALLETHLVKGKGWKEYSVYPLYSPISLIAEGTANYGEKLIFTEPESEKFIIEKLCPLAGIDSSGIQLYLQIQRLTGKLSYSSTDAARQYLDGALSEDETIAWMMKYALRTEQGARQSLSFINTYRSYVINYSLGQDIVKNYIEKNAGDQQDMNVKRKKFVEILSTPFTPKMLK